MWRMGEKMGMLTPQFQSMGLMRGWWVKEPPHFSWNLHPSKLLKGNLWSSAEETLPASEVPRALPTDHRWRTPGSSLSADPRWVMLGSLGATCHDYKPYRVAYKPNSHGQLPELLNWGCTSKYCNFQKKKCSIMIPMARSGTLNLWSKSLRDES